MPVSIEALASPQPIEHAFANLASIDERFSLYKPASELSRYNRADEPQPLSSELTACLERCQQLRQLTNGYFDAWRLGRRFDPTGYVKAWAIRQAADCLEAAGVSNYCINAGGDIVAAGSRRWRVGLQHPFARQRIMATLELSAGAIATSGTYERGTHIINPHTGQPISSVASCTVTGPDIVLSDVFATAAMVMADQAPQLALDFISGQAGYETIWVTASGAVYATTGLEALARQAATSQSVQ